MLLVEGIEVYYGDVQVLKKINLDVKDKEFVAVIGANGAGKTTLMKTISGLLKPREGTITFEGKRISGLEAHKVVAEGIVQVPEGRLLFPDMTVQENLEVGGFLVRDNGVLAQRIMADKGKIEPDTVAQAQSAIQRDIAFLALSKEETEAFYERLSQAAELTYNFDEVELEKTPEAEAAARFLVDLLLGK